MDIIAHSYSIITPPCLTIEFSAKGFGPSTMSTTFTHPGTNRSSQTSRFDSGIIYSNP